MARALALLMLAVLAGCNDPQASVPSVKRKLHAQDLATSGRYEDALNEYLELWQAPDRRASAPDSLAANDVGMLVRRYSPAKLRFTQLRDAAAPKPDAAMPDPAQLDDWLALNEMLGDTATSLVWFDGTPPPLRADPQYSRVLEARVVTLLIGANRWADAGKLYRDPVASLRERDARAKAAKLSWLTRVLAGDVQADLFRDYAMKMIQGLRAAGRTDDVTKVAAEARTLEPSPEMDRAIDAALKAP